MPFPKTDKCNVAVIGLGYVGLPLAVEIAKTKICHRTNQDLNRRVVAFDIDKKRIEELKNCFDRTFEISEEDLKKINNVSFTNNSLLLIEADLFIVTVPTPIDDSKRPLLKYLEEATTLIGKAIKERTNIVEKDSCPLIVYESTVYPKTTEEICVPILERESGLIFNCLEPRKGFVCGYSPERINPGDKNHKLSSIIKVTSGSTIDSANWIDSFYGSIIKAGTYKAKNIQVAEAAKVIENTQRDLNIGLINELEIIFKRLNIDTLDVLEAARTKWNFLDFRPGLVGGHCIGVDPYYLTYKAEQSGYNPQLILAARRINEGMGEWLTNEIIMEISSFNIPLSQAKILILGFTFKENCPDIRNTKVIDIVKRLNRFNINPVVIDPIADCEEAFLKHGIKIKNQIPKNQRFNIVFIAVAHKMFKQFTINEWQSFLEKNGKIIDFKGIVPKEIKPIRL